MQTWYAAEKNEANVGPETVRDFDAVLSRKSLCLVARAVPDAGQQAGLGQIRGHALAHAAKADEASFHVVLLSLCGGIRATPVRAQQRSGKIPPLIPPPTSGSPPSRAAESRLTRSPAAFKPLPRAARASAAGNPAVRCAGGELCDLRHKSTSPGDRSCGTPGDVP